MSLRKCPPLKRRDEARISLDKDGKLVVWTSRGTREATLDAKKREELLDAACACFADFTFNFPYSEASDSERVELSLKSGRRSLQIHLSEYIGETNLKLIAQMQRFSDLAQPDSIKVRDDFMQKSAEPELSPVWGRWQASLEIDRGVRKKTFVSIHDDGAFMIHKTDDSAVPEPRNELLFSGSLATREKESLLRETLESFSQFTFDHDTAHLDGEISITLGLQSGRDRSRARTLMIREQGLRADELSKSFIAPLVAIVNARTPEAKHVPLE